MENTLQAIGGFTFRTPADGAQVGFKHLISGHHRFAALYPNHPDVIAWQSK